MLILAIDTSGKQGSVALARGGTKEFQLIETVSVAGGTFSAQLIPVISALLTRNRMEKEQIDAFAAASGPGSFTGLRVGLAAIKALAEILQKPIAAVSVLEACAAQPALAGYKRILVVLDALRGEVFIGEFEKEDGDVRTIAEQLMSTAELAKYLREAGPDTVACTSDERISGFLRREGLSATEIARPTSVDIARLGIGRILKGQIVRVEELDANYIRRSDAEIFSLPKLRK